MSQKGGRQLKTACLVIPTYNEAGNIKRHLDRILSQKLPQRIKLTILIVDDNSPDGTASIVMRYRWKNPQVHLLFRKEKEGLGAAYVAGIKHAMRKFDPDIVMCMDADGQHNPDDIPRLLTTVIEGADFSIGSRRVEGGRITEDWSALERVKSFCAGLATKTLLGVTTVNDCSGAFRAIRASLLRKMQWDKMGAKGYSFTAVFIEEALHQGAVIVEIPITASKRREYGESKMGITDVLEGFISFSRVRAKRTFSINPRIARRNAQKRFQRARAKKIRLLKRLVKKKNILNRPATVKVTR